MKLRDAVVGEYYLLLDGIHQGKICHLTPEDGGSVRWYEVNGLRPSLSYDNEIRLLQAVPCNDLKDGQEAYIIKWMSQEQGKKVVRNGAHLHTVDGIDRWSDFFSRPHPEDCFLFGLDESATTTKVEHVQIMGVHDSTKVVDGKVTTWRDRPAFW